jgi:phage shock protein C
MNKRLTRSTNNRILGGVCGGIGDYLGIDPVFVRLIFLAFLFVLDISFWVYLVLWLIIPAAEQSPNPEWSDRFKGMGDDIRTAINEPKVNYTIYIGGALVFLGASLLLKQYIPDVFSLLRNITLPLVLIAGGAFILVRAIREK